MFPSLLISIISENEVGVPYQKKYEHAWSFNFWSVDKMFPTCIRDTVSPFKNSAVRGSCFKNSDRFGGPWVPASILKIQTDSAVRGSFFKNSDRFGGPWVPASLLKHRTNSDRFGRPWILLLKFGPINLKIKNRENSLLFPAFLRK